MNRGVKNFADFSMVAEKLKLYSENINKVKSYQDYGDLKELYLEGKSKLNSELEAAKRIATPQRKLILVNDSIARQAMTTSVVRAHLSKLAPRIPHEAAVHVDDIE